MAALVVHALLVGGLLTGAALALEAVLRGRRYPARLAWLGALMGTVTLPLWMLLRRTGGSGVGGDVAIALPVLLEVQPVASTPTLAARGLELWQGVMAGLGDATGAVAGALGDIPGAALVIGVTWALATLALLLVVVTAVFRIRRGTRELPTEQVEGRAVVVSERMGPAVVGVAHPRIVLPRWILAAPQEVRAMVVLHEEEHVRARDTLLMAVGLLLVLCLPWHPAAWYQFRRLRLAIELDCDVRVVRRGVSPLRYAALLLEVGSRPSFAGAAMVGLAESPSLLERRMRALCAPLPRLNTAAAAFSAVAVLLLVLVACEADTPTVQPEAAVTVAEEGTSVPATDLPEGGPTFTPYTVAPALLNTPEVIAALEREYPPLLRDAGVGGQVLVHFFIGEDGWVRDTRVARTSGHQALDQGALRVGRVFRFSPARNLDEPVAVWIALPITFQGSGDPASGSGSDATRLTRPVPAPTAPVERLSTPDVAPLPGGPAFTPYTVAPQLANVREVQEALVREYPPLLRDAGIGGQALIHFFIDDAGAVTDVRVATSSGHAALDQAALRVAGSFRFTPARNQDDAVAVWIALPITFGTPGGGPAPAPGS